MAKIRYLNWFDILSLKKLVSHLTDENFLNYGYELISHPLAIINYAMPLSLKFFPDSFVAVQDGNLKGMISTKLRENNPLKCRITKLLLDENAYETGKQLIDYTVSRYGAKGIETVEVLINSNEKDMIELFSKACGFRYCLDYKTYKLKTDNHIKNLSDTKNFIFRPFKPSDANEVAQLYNQNIITYYKFPLSKNKNEFKDRIFHGLSKNSAFKYILEDKYLKQIRGYLQIETDNNKNYLIEITLLQSYENYFDEAIQFAVSQISRRTNNFQLYFKNNCFHVNAKEFEDILKNNEAELIQTDMIFVKDFFKQIKSDESLIQPAIIYNEINGKPVFKI